MDFYSHSQGEHGRFEQILSQFLLKSLHIILDSRVPAIRPSSNSGELKKSDKWFNLVLGDRPAAMDSLSFWNRSLMEPMVIDIILVQESATSFSEHKSRSTLASDMSKETVVERWVIQYEQLRTSGPHVSDVSHKKTYKKSIVLLRSVFSMLRLLPAYKAFRRLCSSQTCGFDINYQVCSFGTPFSRAEDELMKSYTFAPVDAQQGRLSISVTYREDLSDFNLDAVASVPPEIITDYVGSPLTDPMRFFPSSPSERGVRPTSFPIRGTQRPSPSPFERPHSWTSGIYRGVSSPQNQLFSGSPVLYRSPYEFSSSPTETHIHRTQSQKFPAYNKTMLPDDYQLSPPFSPSPSPSPSPPTYLPGGTSGQNRRRSETAPVSIPHPMMSRSPKYLSPNLSDPSRLPPLSPRHTKSDPSSQDSPSGNRLMRKPDSLRTGESSHGLTNLGPKISRDAKDDSGRFSSLLSSSSSPRVGFSRSSSRVSFQDDFGDCDFSGPFIVDDVDPPDCQNSQNIDGRSSSEASSQAFSSAKRSQDAAVGALVHMLRTAPPLRQDSTSYMQSSRTELQSEAGAASEFFKPRKTSDALDELKTYQVMKDILLSKSGARGV